jgi:hypothetical protein
MLKNNETLCFKIFNSILCFEILNFCQDLNYIKKSGFITICSAYKKSRILYIVIIKDKFYEN